jgi:hypothetical protein
MPEAGLISKSTRPRKSGALRRSASPVSKPARSAAFSFCAFGVWTAVWPGTKRRRERSRRRTVSVRKLAARALPGSTRNAPSRCEIAASYWRRAARSSTVTR